MSTYKFTFEDGSESLAHYGVLGMKWGHRKDPERGSGSGRKGLSDNQKKWIKRAAIGAGVVGLGAAAHITGADRAVINAIRRARVKKLPGSTARPAAQKKLTSGSQALAKRPSGSPFAAAQHKPKASSTKALPSWRSEGTMRNGSFRPAREGGTVKAEPVWTSPFTQHRGDAGKFNVNDFKRKRNMQGPEGPDLSRLKPLKQRRSRIS